MAAKRTRKLLVWALCLHTGLAICQTTFQKTFGGPGNEVATSAIESNNGIVIAGHVTSVNGNQDALLIRLNASGNLVWQNRFGAGQADVFHCVTATPDGGFLATGETRSFGAGKADVFLIKVDASGSIVWSKTLGEADRDDIARSVIPVPNGGFIVSGYSSINAQNGAKSILIRLDASGNTLWSRNYATTNSNLLISSFIDGNVIYASGSVDNDGAFARFDLASGNLLSLKVYGGTGADALQSLQPTQDGQLVVADYTQSTASGTDVELWAQKINRNTGQVLWSKSFYRLYDNLRGTIEKVNDGGFLLVPSDFNHSAQADAILAKIDASGNLLWSYNYGGPTADRFLKAFQMADGGFLAVGDTKSGNGTSDVLVVKTDANGRIQGVCGKNAGVLSLNFNTNNIPVSPSESAWNQGAGQNVSALTLNLQGQLFTANTAPIIAQNIPLCQNKPFILHGVKHYAPKIVNDTIFGLYGCDTIQRYNLTMMAFNPGMHVIGLCSGETYEIDGIHYVAPATVLDTVPSLTGGCDTLCSFILKSKAQSNTAQTVFFCSGETIMIHGQLYTQPDTVHVSIPSISAGECDTLLTYYLVERPQPTVNTTISFCAGESVMIGGNTYDQSGTVNSIIPAMGNGCDTVVTYTLILKPQITRTETIGICPGASVSIGGQNYDQPGTITLNLPSSNGGCDTLVTYQLQYQAQPSKVETYSICPGSSVTIDGQSYSQAASWVANIPASNGGCDTLVTYTLEMQAPITFAQTVGICPGQSMVIAGQTYDQPGTFQINIPSNTGGCDTVATYTLELQQQIVRTEIHSFCPGESVVINGHTYTQPGAIQSNVAAANGGCDTLIMNTLQYLTPAPSNIAIQCPNDITIVANDGSRTLAANYAEPIAASDCICPGLEIIRTNGLASGSFFPVGNTQVCYTAKDNCGQEKPCCFSVNIQEEDPCDIKLSGCVKYELLSVTADDKKNHTYRIRVTNNCDNKLIYTAIQVPDGVATLAPANNSTYTSPEGRSYSVRTPNFSPMYSVRFKSTTDSISNGKSDIFEYTLPAQTEVSYIQITSRLASRSTFHEAHLNTFNCIEGITPVTKNGAGARDAEVVEVQNSLLLFPNPTSGVLNADLSDWQGQKLQLQITNTQGQVVQTLKHLATEDLLKIELNQGLISGTYFLEIAAENGSKEVMRFVVKR